jgi:hypothetical protein
MIGEFLLCANESKIMSYGRDKAFADMISDKIELVRAKDEHAVTTSRVKTLRLPRKFCSLEDGDIDSLASKGSGSITSGRATTNDENLDVLPMAVNKTEAKK